MGPWIYDRACTLEDRRSRIFWIRTVVAKAIGQPVVGEADFSLKVRWQGKEARRIALIHGTADRHRLWPEEDWVGLGRFLVARGHELVLPWGNAEEKARAQRLVAAIDPQHCHLGPTLSVAGWAQALSQCRAVIGLDTGLTHIAAAVGVPCLGIFNLTDPALLTAQAPAPLETTGGHGRQSTLDEVQAASERLLGRRA
jgi:heptosyltransferase-1